MSINDYDEKTIRDKVLKKVKPRDTQNYLAKGKHDKLYLYVDGKMESKVKLPNNHKRIMRERKSRFIAVALKLRDDEFNNLIDCPLSGPKYYDLFKARLRK